jgi:DNA-binding NarL/FixJ family response regulator
MKAGAAGARGHGASDGRQLNKQVGGDLGISEITVKARREQVMRRMKADSLAEWSRWPRASACRPHRSIKNPSARLLARRHRYQSIANTIVQ